MPTYIQRNKSGVEAFKGSAANNAFVRELDLAHVWLYPSDWNATLTSQGRVINPANSSDLEDVGTLDGDGNFTPDDNPTKNKLLALHWLRRNRQTNVEILKAYRLMKKQIAAGDVGKTPQQLEQDLRTAADAEAKTELGDPDNDPET